MSLSEHFRTNGKPKKKLSAEGAHWLAEHIRATDGENVVAYECSFCYAFHIGHSR